MTGFVIAIVAMAVAGTPHCLGMCGGFATAAAEGGLLPYQLGRIATYAMLGAVAGAAGRWIPGPSWWATGISVVLVVAMAASLAGWLPEPKLQFPGLPQLGKLLRGRRGALAALLMGVLNGLLPCGLLYGALALPVASGDPVSGAGLMVVFGVFTAAPLTIAAGGLRRALRSKPLARKILALVVLISGLAGLGMRAPTGHDAEAPSCHEPAP